MVATDLAMRVASHLACEVFLGCGAPQVAIVVATEVANARNGRVLWRHGRRSLPLQHQGRVGRLDGELLAGNLADGVVPRQRLQIILWASKAQARRVVAGYIDRYNRTRLHSSCEWKSPVDYGAILAARAAPMVPEDEAA